MSIQSLFGPYRDSRTSIALSIGLLFDPLLQVLNEVVPRRSPLVISVRTNGDHEIGSLSLTHLRMKPFSQIPHRVSPPKTRQPTVDHE